MEEKRMIFACLFEIKYKLALKRKRKGLKR